MSHLSPPDPETVEGIVEHLSRSRSILFVTGAGMSADSGLPTYRGVGGPYNRGETEEGFAIEEMLSAQMLPEEGISELKNQLREGFDLTFSIGTTSAFPYISFPVELAVQRSKPSVEINPGTTRVSDLVTYRLELTAAVALEAVWKRYQG